jgi:hypothetical protein
MKKLAVLATATFFLIGCTNSRYYDRSTLREMAKELDGSKTAMVSLKNGGELPEAGVFMNADTLFYPGINYLMLDQVKKITVMDKNQGTYKTGLFFGLMFGTIAAGWGYMSGDDYGGKTAGQKAVNMGLIWGMAGMLFGAVIGSDEGYPVYYYYSDTLNAQNNH